ncbi:MAG: alpha-mannosidase, partial [Anaerolineae bacterium]|nr:alpha-mannosidase [Anaerolineae bacterium]
RWGAKWEYGWFKTQISLPQEAAGKRIVLKADVGGESAVYINGQAAGAIDTQHQYVLLTPKAALGDTFKVLIEAYAGHGPRVSSVGPVPPGRVTVPEPGPTQATVGESSFGIWEEEIYQLWLDVETLYQLRDNLDPDSLRVAEIDQGLRDFTILVDLELPYEEMLKTVRAGRERLKPLLDCVNGSTAPTMFMFGHAHIDVAWLWPLAETERKCVRTFATQLALMKEYPEYKFLQSQAHLYQRTKELYPSLYAQIKEVVARGQWIPEGGMWVEADTNLSGGESLIRQFIHGKRFFREEFGVNCELLWLPDVFGYSGNLPQIMRGCGIKYFATAKIFWNYNGGDPFLYNTFTWEGIDGSTVLVHLCNDYNSRTDPTALSQRWKQRVQKDGIATRLFPFGWGDGGGGPTRDHLEFIRRERNLEGLPKALIAHPLDFFRDQEKRGLPEARYVGELYYQAHRGTYTSQARTKRGNRKSELALREAEMWGSIARALKNYELPLKQLDTLWKQVLLNQFHDIIPGSSIHRVYEEAEAGYAKVLAGAAEIAQEATQALVEKKKGLTIFNSLSWERKELVPLPKGTTGAKNLHGDPLPTQKIGERIFAEVSIPPCGWTTIFPSAEGSSSQSSSLIATERSLENEYLCLSFNERGEITSIFDKVTGREWAAGLCNAFKMYKDVPTKFDAWDIDSMYSLTPVPLEARASIEVTAQGPLVAKLRLTRKLHQSTLTQEIVLRRGSRRVDFITQIDWQESHKLLKVAFPVRIHTNEAVHEIQFGHIRRPNHKSRPFDADRFEVCQHKWTALMEEGRGFALLNDCKYGVNVLGNAINLTLLKAALAPDMTADKGLQEFTYALYLWEGPFLESELVQEAYALNCPVLTAPGSAGEGSIFTVDAPNVVIETVKPAEDGSSDIIIRLYEAKRSATSCRLHTRLPVHKALKTDMLENILGSLPVEQGTIPLEFRPFEIKTIRLQLAHE